VGADCVAALPLPVAPPRGVAGL